MFDPESLAGWVYAEALWSEDDPPGPGTLLQRIVGSRAIRFDDRDRVDISGHPDAFQVVIPRSSSPERMCLSMGTALAAIASLSGAPPAWLNGEPLRRVIAAIIMPRTALLRATLHLGPRADAIARAFLVPRLLAEERLRSLGMSLASGSYPRLVAREVG